MSARDALRAMRERAEAATEGPWELGEVQRYSEGRITIRYVDIEPNVVGGIDPVDAEFIAHARTDVPALVKALEAVLRVLDELSDEGIAQYKTTGRVYYDGYSDGAQVAELRALDAIETALGGVS